MEAKYINLSKLDVAKRQLEFAIKLFFRYGDTVVIHALSSAAHEVLWGLCKKQNIKSILKDHMYEMVKKEKHEEVGKMLTKAQNFFKHASKDPDEHLKFFFEATQFTIFDACLMYKELTKESNPFFIAFISWFYMNHPGLLLDEKLKEDLQANLLTINPADRQLFLEMIPIIEERLTPK